MYVSGWRGVLVDMNLANPWRRGLAAALLTGVTAYATGGHRRPDGRVDGKIFFWPLGIGTAVFLLT